MGSVSGGERVSGGGGNHQGVGNDDVHRHGAGGGNRYQEATDCENVYVHRDDHHLRDRGMHRVLHAPVVLWRPNYLSFLRV